MQIMIQKQVLLFSASGRPQVNSFKCSRWRSENCFGYWLPRAWLGAISTHPLQPVQRLQVFWCLRQGSVSCSREHLFKHTSLLSAMPCTVCHMSVPLCHRGLPGRTALCHSQTSSEYQTRWLHNPSPGAAPPCAGLRTQIRQSRYISYQPVETGRKAP